MESSVENKLTLRMREQKSHPFVESELKLPGRNGSELSRIAKSLQKEKADPGGVSHEEELR